MEQNEKIQEDSIELPISEEAFLHLRNARKFGVIYFLSLILNFLSK
jgi:hypothetical protein